MAHKLIHRQLPQEVRFPNRPTAEQYADLFGGLANWDVIVIGSRQPVPPPVTGRSGGG